MQTDPALLTQPPWEPRKSTKNTETECVLFVILVFPCGQFFAKKTRTRVVEYGEHACVGGVLAWCPAFRL